MARTVLHCVLASPDRLVFQGDARSVVVPAEDGELGILPRHAPLIAKLGDGELRIERAETAPEAGGAPLVRYFVQGGFVQVLRDQVNIISTEVEPVEAIDGARVQVELDDLAAARPKAGVAESEREAYEARVRVARKRARTARMDRTAKG